MAHHLWIKTETEKELLSDILYSAIDKLLEEATADAEDYELDEKIKSGQGHS